MSLHQFQMICGDAHLSLMPSENSPQLDMILLGLHHSHAAVFSVASEQATALNVLHDEFLKEIKQRGLKTLPLLGCSVQTGPHDVGGDWSPWVMVLGLEPVAAHTVAKRYQKQHVLVYRFGFTLEYLMLEGEPPVAVSPCACR